MALTREQIEAQIAEIDAKLTSGAERVSHGDSSVAFSFSELRRRKQELSAQLATLDGAAPRVRQVRFYSTKGL